MTERGANPFLKLESVSRNSGSRNRGRPAGASGITFDCASGPTGSAGYDFSVGEWEFVSQSEVERRRDDTR